MRFCRNAHRANMPEECCGSFDCCNASPPEPLCHTIRGFTMETLLSPKTFGRAAADCEVGAVAVSLRRFMAAGKRACNTKIWHLEEI